MWPAMREDLAGGVRLCGNYKGMNEFMINRNLRIPVVREEINKCLGFSVFAELDWERAYHQIRLHPEDSPRLATSRPRPRSPFQPGAQP